MTSPEARLRRAAATVGANARWAGVNHPATQSARRELREERLERIVRAELATFPQLSERCRDSLATLLLTAPVQPAPDDHNHGGRQ